MLSTALGVCAALGLVAGLVLRFRRKPAGAWMLVLSIGLLGAACLADSTREINAVDFRHERELMTFRWMAQAAGALFLGIAVVAGARLGSRKP